MSFGQRHEGCRLSSLRCELATAPPETDPRALSTTLSCVLPGGMLLARKIRDATPLDTAITTVLDHIRSPATDPGPTPG